MKKLITLITLVLISFYSFGQTVLTDAQKELLYADASFKLEVRYGILNKAAFWVGTSGTAVPGGQTDANITKWAKCRFVAADLVANPVTAEQDVIVKQFLIYAKTTAVWQGSTSATVSYMLTNSIFDTLADTWFTNTVATRPF